MSYCNQLCNLTDCHYRYSLSPSSQTLMGPSWIITLHGLHNLLLISVCIFPPFASSKRVALPVSVGQSSILI